MKYCPRCRANQPTFELLDLGQPELRCAACGFPLEEPELLTRELPASQDPASQNKVLCIDDDPLMLRILTDTLKAHGFVTLTAPNGPAGIALAAAERPRLILVDIMMPGMDGFEVCRRLRADPGTQAIPLVILTAMADPKLNIKAFQAGADLALTKPFHPGHLISTLRAALAMKARRQRP